MPNHELVNNAAPKEQVRLHARLGGPPRPGLPGVQGVERLAAARPAEVLQPRAPVPEAGVQEPDQGERERAGEPAVRGAEVADNDSLGVDEFQGGREVEGPFVGGRPMCRSDSVAALVVHGGPVLVEEPVQWRARRLGQDGEGSPWISTDERR